MELTGKMLYEANQKARPKNTLSWDNDLTIGTRQLYDDVAALVNEALQIKGLEQLIMDYRSHSNVLLACLEQDSEAITNYDGELDRRGAKLGLWPEPRK